MNNLSYMQMIIGEGGNAEGTPVVDWIDVNPVTGVATPGGIFVDLTLVLSQVPYGLNSAAVVFVADMVASPPAVVVRASALRTQPNVTGRNAVTGAPGGVYWFSVRVSRAANAGVRRRACTTFARLCGTVPCRPAGPGTAQASA
jgi:hypothetical protein